MTVAQPLASGDRSSRAGRAGLSRCLDRLDDALRAARELGLPVDEAEAVRAEADVRLGLSSDVYVLGLVGGTGVGKSTLLNALAGGSVSPASVLRPTTAEPVAWVPASARDRAQGLLERLSVGRVVEHPEMPGSEGLVVLDLPDLDSVASSHRERVEELLPRLDAVVWVTDPEKYHDAVLHDDFLHAWLPRLERQAVLLNKVDRLEPADGERIRRDLGRDLRIPAGGTRVPVILGAARDGADGLREFRAWLDAGIEAKVVVAGRLATAAAAAVEDLARTGGVDPAVGARAFLEGPARRAAIDRATEEVLRLVDLAGLERQAVAATRARARRRGAGPLGWLSSLIYRISGREARAADPAGHLRRWRDRGAPVLAVEALRAAVAGPLREAAPAVRPALAASTDAPALTARLSAVVDGVVAAKSGEEAPRSRLWPVLGLLQTLAVAAVAVSAGWLVLYLLTRPPVASLEVPGLGPVPMPYAALIVSVLAGYVLARLLGLHAGLLGRRWAGRLRGDVRKAIESTVASDAYAALDRLEHARRSLWLAARGTVDCRPK